MLQFLLKVMPDLLTPCPAFDVLGLGSVAWDEILTIDSWPAADAKVRIRDRAHRCGGLTGNALIAAARLGVRAAYAGRLGDDVASRAVERAFAGEGIDTTFAPRDALFRVGQSTIITSTTDATRNVFSFSPGGTGAHDDLPDENLIRRAAVLVVDHHGLDGTARAIRIARSAGVGVVADFERDEAQALMPLVDHLILSEAFALRITASATAAEAASRLWHAEREAVVVTCGASGAWFISRENLVPTHLPAYPVVARDTTGCGDVFHGVYAAALALGSPLAERLRLASAAGALKASGPGIPRNDDIRALSLARAD